jgi:hypothetical protein
LRNECPEAEGAVGTINDILKKNEDPYLALWLIDPEH